jgi:hypothetical protein
VCSTSKAGGGNLITLEAILSEKTGGDENQNKKTKRYTRALIYSTFLSKEMWTLNLRIGVIHREIYTVFKSHCFPQSSCREKNQLFSNKRKPWEKPLFPENRTLLP